MSEKLKDLLTSFLVDLQIHRSINKELYDEIINEFNSFLIKSVNDEMISKEILALIYRFYQTLRNEYESNNNYVDLLTYADEVESRFSLLLARSIFEYHEPGVPRII